MNGTKTAGMTQQHPGYAIERPSRQTFAAVFSSPHSGRVYPKSFLAASKLDPLALRSSEDCFVEQLFAGAVTLGCPLLHAHFPRAFLDVNREPYELDPAMFSDPLPMFVNASSHRVAGGLGTVPRVVAENQAIYRGSLRWPDVKTRIETLYFPYHRALSGLMEDTLRLFSSALLIDCHSMPSSAVRQTSSGFSGRADIVIGDRFGATCDSDLTTYLCELFSRNGLSAVRNKPYAGGYITQTYGKSRHVKQAMQIEINRGLYMNEQTLEPINRFCAVRDTISLVLGQFLESLAGNQPELPIAAE